MERLFIREERWQAFLKSLAGRARIFAPRAEGDDYHLGVFDAERPETGVFNSYRCVQSFKALLFEARIGVGSYFGGAGEEKIEEPGERIIVGAKACDIRGLAVLDFVFRDAEPDDPFYRARRERTLIISSDCTNFKEVCFCTLVGGAPHPTEGYDINLAPVAGGYVVEPGSERGRGLIEQNRDYFSRASASMTEAMETRRREITEGLEERQRTAGFLWKGKAREILERAYDSAVWKEEAERCVECGACNFVCPTCHCFLLSDEGREAFKRLRTWDSCQYRGFARVGGGASPRPELYQRLRNRYEKKFDFCREVVGVSGCTGCGRCVEACIGRIDMREVLNRLGGSG